jgi:hypothetical protein
MRASVRSPRERRGVLRNTCAFSHDSLVARTAGARRPRALPTPVVPVGKRSSRPAANRCTNSPCRHVLRPRSEIAGGQGNAVAGVPDYPPHLLAVIAFQRSVDHSGLERNTLCERVFRCHEELRRLRGVTQRQFATIARMAHYTGPELPLLSIHRGYLKIVVG